MNAGPLTTSKSSESLTTQKYQQTKQ